MPLQHKSGNADTDCNSEKNANLSYLNHVIWNCVANWSKKMGKVETSNIPRGHMKVIQNPNLL